MGIMKVDGHKFIIRAFFIVSLLVAATLCFFQSMDFFVKSDAVVFGMESTVAYNRLLIHYECLIILFHTLLPGIVILYWGNQRGILCAIFTWILYSFILVLFFKMFHVVLPFTAPAVGAVVSIIRVMGWGSCFLEEEKTLIKSAFSHFLEPSVVEMLLNNPELISQNGTKKVVTILFGDMRGFSKICEIKSAELVTTMLREYFTVMIRVARNNRGTVDKLIGDGLMVVFGFPIPMRDHSDYALQTALEMQLAMSGLREDWRRRFDVDVGMGIGINTDEVVVGTIGSDEFYDYTVLGNGVNLASRIESDCPAGEIHVSQKSFEILKDKYPFEYIGEKQFKNFNNKEEVYRVRS